MFVDARVPFLTMGRDAAPGAWSCVLPTVSGRSWKLGAPHSPAPCCPWWWWEWVALPLQQSAWARSSSFEVHSRARRRCFIRVWCPHTHCHWLLRALNGAVWDSQTPAELVNISCNDTGATELNICGTECPFFPLMFYSCLFWITSPLPSAPQLWHILHGRGIFLHRSIIWGAKSLQWGRWIVKGGFLSGWTRKKTRKSGEGIFGKGSISSHHL